MQQQGQRQFNWSTMQYQQPGGFAPQTTHFQNLEQLGNPAHLYQPLRAKSPPAERQGRPFMIADQVLPQPILGGGTSGSRILNSSLQNQQTSPARQAVSPQLMRSIDQVNAQVHDLSKLEYLKQMHRVRQQNTMGAAQTAHTNLNSMVPKGIHPANSTKSFKSRFSKTQS